jgi:F-type H+-transporting ATPase subunit b
MKSTIALLGLLLAPSLAMAAEGGGESNLFAGDIGTAVWTLVIFLLVIFVLGKFAWGPMLEGLQSREQFIRDSLEEAKTENEKAKALLAEYEEKVELAKAEATAIVDEGRKDAEAVKRQIEDQTRTEADTMIERAKREITLAQQTAVKEIYATSAHLATDLASRILSREVTADDHERLISESIENIERRRTN